MCTFDTSTCPLWGAVSLGKRAGLLEQMERRKEQMKVLRKQQVERSEAARQRNNTLLQVGWGLSIPKSHGAMECTVCVCV